MYENKNRLLKYQYLTNDSEVRIYLSAERKEEDSIPERIVIFTLKIFFAYSVSYFSSLLIIPFAYQERGYKAYGGEYILLLAIFIAAYKIISIFFKYFRREKTWKRGK